MSKGKRKKTKVATPLEHKTTHATAATGIMSILFAVLYGQTDGVDVTWLPMWAQPLVIVILPTLVTAWAAFRAPHTPRPELRVEDDIATEAAAYRAVVTTYGTTITADPNAEELS